MIHPWIPGPVLSILLVLALLAFMLLGYLWTCRAPKNVRASRRARLSAWCREILGTRAEIPADGEPLSLRERLAVDWLEIAYRVPDLTAPEPRYERRPR